MRNPNDQQAIFDNHATQGSMLNKWTSQESKGFLNPAASNARESYDEKSNLNLPRPQFNNYLAHESLPKTSTSLSPRFQLAKNVNCNNSNNLQMPFYNATSIAQIWSNQPPLIHSVANNSVFPPTFWRDSSQQSGGNLINSYNVPPPIYPPQLFQQQQQQNGMLPNTLQAPKTLNRHLPPPSAGLTLNPTNFRTPSIPPHVDSGGIARFVVGGAGRPFDTSVPPPLKSNTSLESSNLSFQTQQPPFLNIENSPPASTSTPNSQQQLLPRMMDEAIDMFVPPSDAAHSKSNSLMYWHDPDGAEKRRQNALGTHVWGDPNVHNSKTIKLWKESPIMCPICGPRCSVITSVKLSKSALSGGNLVSDQRTQQQPLQPPNFAEHESIDVSSIRNNDSGWKTTSGVNNDGFLTREWSQGENTNESLPRAGATNYLSR